MYFYIIVYGITKEKLGEILSKHPNGTFQTDAGAGRFVIGLWMDLGDDLKDGNAGYKVMVRNDPVKFLEAMKNLNSANYIHPQLSAVCPFNLVSWKAAFKTTLQNKSKPNPTQINKDENNETNDINNTNNTNNTNMMNDNIQLKYKIEAVLGPWTATLESISLKFQDAGIQVTKITTDPIFDKSSHPKENLQKTFKFETMEPMTVVEFIQKIYVFSYLISSKVKLTSHHSEKHHSQKDKLRDTLSPFAVDWVDSLKKTSKSKWLLYTPQHKLQVIASIEAKFKSKSESQSKSESETKPESEPEIKSESESESESKSKSKSESESEKLEENNPEKRIYDEITTSILTAKIFKENNNNNNNSKEYHILDYGGQSGKLLLHIRALLQNSSSSSSSSSSFPPGTNINANLLLIDNDIKGQYQCQRKNITCVRSNLLLPPLSSLYQFLHLPVNNTSNSSNSSMKKIEIEGIVVVSKILTRYNHKNRIAVFRDVILHKLKPEKLIVWDYLQENEEDKKNLQEEEWKEILQILKVEHFDITEVSPLIIFAQKKMFPQKTTKKNSSTKKKLESSEEPLQQQTKEISNVVKVPDFKKEENLGVNPMFLPGIQYQISYSEISTGAFSNHFITNAENILFLAPTIPPCDFLELNSKSLNLNNEVSKQQTEKTETLKNFFFEEKENLNNFLEHPESVYNYYKQHNLPTNATTLYAEKKYMGSRAQIFVQKSNSSSKKTIEIYSRNGQSFLKTNEKNRIFMDKVYEEICEKFLETENLEWCVLDGEMLPWSFKAQELIEQSFLLPGIICNEDRLYLFGSSSPSKLRSESFLSVLNWFSKQNEENEKLNFRVFNIIAAGKVEDSKFKVSYFGHLLSSAKKYSLISRFDSKSEGESLVKGVEWMEIKLGEKESEDRAVSAWKEYCSLPSCGEGFIFKLGNEFANSLSENGNKPSRMFKVRGQEYLRLVYGIDYLVEPVFERLKERKGAMKQKKMLALVQEELSESMLKCWIRGFDKERMRFIAAFFGCESTRTIDATL